MATIDPNQVWEDAASPPAEGLASRFASAWRARPVPPPDPADFLPDDPARRPSALLALLRTDMTLRHKAGRPARLEDYVRRFPDLSGDSLVALVYEEFCLREESGESPDPAEYESRFPEAATQIRDVIDIHEFVDSARDLIDDHDTLPATAPFPRAGETIGGFRLIEELGRGAIARVFLAEERLLADRRVALKVSRAGSREPQALARLQHTHIVPVHSYRVDPATGLHLLCMPYFGRLTLADVLADPRSRLARSGAELVAALDALRPLGESPSPRAEGRAALAGRPFARGIAWWGARLAEALQHAHDRGVLHRDVKPSNVLITADALPMLLDFNLARPSDDPAGGEAPMGGTLAYMAPEHLDAAAECVRAGQGADVEVDGRADVYSLGLVLLEALVARPAPTTTGELRALINERRTAAPGPQKGEPGRAVPAALDAVIRRCLAPNPADRYDSPADLAADLQAVADDAPLLHIREPQPGRLLRWTRRNRKGITLGVALIAGLLASASAFIASREAGLRRETLVRFDIAEGDRQIAEGQFVAAASRFALASERASATRRLQPLAEIAATKGRNAVADEQIRSRADAFLRKIEPLKFRLVTQSDLTAVSRELAEVFADFRVFGPTPWTRNLNFERLDPERRRRLLEEVNETLFLWVVRSDRLGDPDSSRRAAAICDLALTFAEPKTPWLALRSRYTREKSTDLGVESDPSARACFQWGLLAVLGERPDRALAWLDRAVRLGPDQFWYQFALAYHHSLYGESDQALAHYDAAVALRPDSSWALLNRAQLSWSRRGEWERALADLERVKANPDGLDPAVLSLEFGRVAQKLGNFPEALSAYHAVLASDPKGGPARHARLGRAKIEAELGPAGVSRALADYEALLAADSDDPEARFGRAVLALGSGQANAAEVDLNRLLTSPETNPARRADWFATRSLARIATARPADAVSDAEEAVHLDPTPARRRVRARAALAASDDSWLTALDPDEIDRLPARGPGFVADLNAATERLRAVVEGSSSFPASLALSVILSARDRHADACVSADRAITLGPQSAEARLVSAYVLRRSGDLHAALNRVTEGLVLAPGEPRLATLRARLLVEKGRPQEALLAVSKGNTPAPAERARALWQLERLEEAATAWTHALRADLDDTEAFLGRARCYARLGRWDAALADLESSLDAAPGRTPILPRIAAAYAGCLPARPNRLDRVVTLALRSLPL